MKCGCTHRRVDTDMCVSVCVCVCVASRLEPPASGFITTGHILGCDELLNVAFIGRLFTTHGHLEKTIESNDIKKYLDKVQSLQNKWNSQKQFVE